MSRCLWAIWLTGCYASWSSPPGSDPGSDGGSFEPDSVCGSDDASVHVVEPFQSPELFVVGIYAPSNPPAVTVEVDRVGSVELVLSAYWSTDWTVTAGRDTQLERIIVNAGESATVDAPAGTEVEIHDGGDEWDAVAEFDQRWPDANWGRRGLAVFAEELTGHPLSAFVGCAEGAVFRFGRD